MDEVSLYRRALAVGEIQTIFNAGSAGKCIVKFPALITSQPQSQTVIVGADVTFSVTAAGTGPLTYQWRKNGNTIVGATIPTLALSNVQFSDVGTYSAVVSNLVGSMTS